MYQGFIARSLDTTVAEMTSDLSKSPNFNGIGITDNKVGGDIDQQAISDNEKMTGFDPSRSWKCSFALGLPPELLAGIFCEYVRHSYSAFNSTIVPCWISVSYVCRYWRDVALHCANLWAYLFFVSPEWMDELLSRSKNAPLIVHTHMFFDSRSGQGPIRSLEKALGNMERIQELWIYCSSDIIEMIGPKLNVAAPLLQSLCLSTWRDDHEYRSVINKDTLPGAMPDLRKVHLESCHVDWSSPVFNGLTELTIRYTLNDPMECWNGLQFILGHLPRLRQLHLDTLLPYDTDMDALSTNPRKDKFISLPHLELLTLTGPISWLIALLTQLKFPKTTIVRVECGCDDPQAASRLLPLIQDQFDSHPSMTASAQTVRYLDLYHDNKCWQFTYGLSTANAYGSDSLWDHQQGSQMVVIHMLDFESDDILPWFRGFSVAQLNVITLNGDIEGNFDDEDLWTEAFQDPSELHTVKVESGRIENFIWALHPCDGVVPAPNLIDISLSDIQFDRCSCSCGWVHAGVGDIQCLFDALARRAEAGNMLPTLVLVGCTGITEDDVIKLSKVVGQVECRCTTPRVKLLDT